MRIGDRYYCDFAATTPVSEGVAAAMSEWHSKQFQNPSSIYAGGQKARRAVDAARDKVAAALNCLPGEIFFTSSGTEAVNLALMGTALHFMHGRRTRILISAGEHDSALNTAPLLHKWGYRVELIPLEASGCTDLEKLATMISDDVLLVAAMSANNETGVNNDVRKIGEICRSNGALFFCDAIQSFGLLPVEIDADMVAVSAHKLYGPKGVGALMIRAGAKCDAVMVGGGQERELRAGTENVAGIVGFGVATDEALADTNRAERIRQVRDQFLRQLQNSSLQLAVTPNCGLPGHAHFRIRGMDAQMALINLDRAGIEASAGAACSSGSIEPSHVLLAMGWTNQEAKEAMRFSFGASSTVEDAGEIVKRMESALQWSSFSSGKRGTHG